MGTKKSLLPEGIADEHRAIQLTRQMLSEKQADTYEKIKAACPKPEVQAKLQIIRSVRPTDVRGMLDSRLGCLGCVAEGTILVRLVTETINRDEIERFIQEAADLGCSTDKFITLSNYTSLYYWNDGGYLCSAGGGLLAFSTVLPLDGGEWDAILRGEIRSERWNMPLPPETVTVEDLR